MRWATRAENAYWSCAPNPPSTDCVPVECGASRDGAGGRSGVPGERRPGASRRSDRFSHPHGKRVAECAHVADSDSDPDLNAGSGGNPDPDSDADGHGAAHGLALPDRCHGGGSAGPDGPAMAQEPAVGCLSSARVAGRAQQRTARSGSSGARHRRLTDARLPDPEHALDAGEWVDADLPVLGIQAPGLGHRAGPSRQVPRTVARVRGRGPRNQRHLLGDTPDDGTARAHSAGCHRPEAAGAVGGPGRRPQRVLPFPGAVVQPDDPRGGRRPCQRERRPLASSCQGGECRTIRRYPLRTPRVSAARPDGRQGLERGRPGESGTCCGLDACAERDTRAKRDTRAERDTRAGRVLTLVRPRPDGTIFWRRAGNIPCQGVVEPIRCYP